MSAHAIVLGLTVFAVYLLIFLFATVRR